MCSVDTCIDRIQSFGTNLWHDIKCADEGRGSTDPEKLTASIALRAIGLVAAGAAVIGAVLAFSAVLCQAPVLFLALAIITVIAVVAAHDLIVAGVDLRKVVVTDEGVERGANDVLNDFENGKIFSGVKKIFRGANEVVSESFRQGASPHAYLHRTWIAKRVYDCLPKENQD